MVVERAASAQQQKGWSSVWYYASAATPYSNGGSNSQAAAPPRGSQSQSSGNNNSSTNNHVWLPGVVISVSPVPASSKDLHTFVISPGDVCGEEGAAGGGSTGTGANLVQVTTERAGVGAVGGSDFALVKRRDASPSSALAGVADMTRLSFLNEPEMLHCLECRFLPPGGQAQEQEPRIYTNIGHILMAVNPFKPLPGLYSNDLLWRYVRAGPRQLQQELGPHVFQVGRRAYDRMLWNKFNPTERENQSVLVNGESGAGKTESIKQVLHYLAETSEEVAAALGVQCGSGRFETLLLASNPITESFGNAKTSRNNNSSRFGKFIELQYTAEGYIAGANIRTYLLETMRVVSQLKGERNYHVFYEVFAGLTAQQRADWRFGSLADFAYLSRSGEYMRHDGESDAENFTRLCQALDRIGVSDAEQEDIFKIVVCILHLGNVSFTSSGRVGDDGATFDAKSKDNVRLACDFLGIDEDQLLGSLTRRTLHVAGNTIEKVLDPVAATTSRDVFAKCIYDALFRLMIASINSSVAADDMDVASFIGLLDIFGFEFFDANSLEQLFINYANEKLQDHFNYSVFKSEREIYEEEGLAWTFTDYPDNAERLELFEHRSHGMYTLFDDQLKVPKPSDEKLASTLYAKCGAHRHFEATKAMQARGEFLVRHFACDVKYSTASMIEKNRNDVPPELFECFQFSSKRLVRRLNQVSAVQRRSLSRSGSQLSPPSKKGAAMTKKATTLASQFSKQLQELVAKIRTTRSHFIRCIKSNNQLVPGVFDRQLVMTQLKCGGALGALQVFHAGFPNRMEFKSFVTRYVGLIYICGLNALTREFAYSKSRALSTESDESWRLAAARLVDIVPICVVILNLLEKTDVLEAVCVSQGLQLGKTMVFLKAPVFELLESMHSRIEALAVCRIQRAFVGRAGQTGAKAKIASALAYYSNVRCGKLRSVVSSTILLQRRARVFIAVVRRKRAIASSTAICNCIRSFLARRLVSRLRRDKMARRLQICIRGWTKRSRYQQMRLSAYLAQRVWRGVSARMKCGEYRRQKLLMIAEQKRAEDEERRNFMNFVAQKLQENPGFFEEVRDSKVRQQQLLDRAAELTTERDKSLKEKEELRSELANKTQALSSLSADVEALRGRIAEMENSMSQMQSENSELKNKLALQTESIKVDATSTSSKAETLVNLLEERSGSDGPTVRGGGGGRRASAPPATLSASVAELSTAAVSAPSSSHAVAAVAARNRQISPEAPISGAVTSWTRINSGDVVFVVFVRITNAKWNVIKTYNEFKLLRMRLLVALGTRVVLPELPPSSFHIFSLPDVDVDKRREGLHGFLTELRKIIEIYTSPSAFQILSEFFGAEEYYEHFVLRKPSGPSSGDHTPRRPRAPLSLHGSSSSSAVSASSGGGHARGDDAVDTAHLVHHTTSTGIIVRVDSE